MKTSLHSLTAAGLSLLLFPAILSAQFTAADNADNEPYASSGAWAEHDNGGDGFSPWAVPSSVGQGFMSLEANFDDNRNHGWLLGGVYSAHRGLEEDLVIGTLTVQAKHYAGTHFSGFTLYNSSDVNAADIFRFGMMTAGTDASLTGIYYSTDAGQTYIYQEFDGTMLTDEIIQYSFTWNSVGAWSLSLDIASFGFSENISGLFDSAETISAIGAMTLSVDNDGTFAFNNIAVSGDPSVVPEPATAALLLLGAAACLHRRLNRR